MAVSIPERGRRTEILSLAVPPQLEGAAGSGLGAAVYPDLVGLVFSAAGEGQIEGTARIEGVLNGAEVGHLGIVVGDGKVILSHVFQRKTPGGRTAFRFGKLIHLIGDERAVQVVLPHPGDGQGQIVAVLGDLHILTHRPQGGDIVLVLIAHTPVGGEPEVIQNLVAEGLFGFLGRRYGAVPEYHIEGEIPLEDIIPAGRRGTDLGAAA